MCLSELIRYTVCETNMHLGKKKNKKNTSVICTYRDSIYIENFFGPWMWKGKEEKTIDVFCKVCWSCFLAAELRSVLCGDVTASHWVFVNQKSSYSTSWLFRLHLVYVGGLMEVFTSLLCCVCCTFVNSPPFALCAARNHCQKWLVMNNAFHF